MLIGGREPLLALDMLDAAKKAMMPPHFEISVMADPSGAFTTAAGMVAVVERHLKSKGTDLSGRRVAVFGATGPVGAIAGLIAAKAGAKVTLVGYDGLHRVTARADQFGERFGVAMAAADGSDEAKNTATAAGAEVILAAGRAGVQILSSKQLAAAANLLAAVDVNAVPPSGLEGLDAFANGTPIEGTPGVGFGALAVGNVKFKTEHELLASMRDAQPRRYIGVDEAFEAARRHARLSRSSIVALSGRALAQSARAAGWAPFVLDAFGDLDVREAAAAMERVPVDGDWRFVREALLEAADRLAPPPIPLVYGSGFERHPDLLEALAREGSCWARHRPRSGTPRTRSPLPGCSRPRACRIRTCGPSHRTTCPAGWSSAGQERAAGISDQPRRGGPDRIATISAGWKGGPSRCWCVGDGSEAVSLAASEQWTDPTPDRPFRYGGAAAPAEVPATSSKRRHASLPQVACAGSAASTHSWMASVIGSWS